MIQKKQSIAFNGHKEDWDNFRLICKLQDKNASVEVRKFINKYITANMDILIEFEAQEKQLKEDWINDEN
jgi:hypothetical protein